MPSPSIHFICETGRLAITARCSVIIVSLQLVVLQYKNGRFVSPFVKHPNYCCYFPPELNGKHSGLNYVLYIILTFVLTSIKTLRTHSRHDLYVRLFFLLLASTTLSHRAAHHHKLLLPQNKMNHPVPQSNTERGARFWLVIVACLAVELLSALDLV